MRVALACDATVLVGPYSHAFYVAPTAVYVWTSDVARDVLDGLRSGSILYRMPLDGTPPTAIGVEGSPVDQFSFLESEDGHIKVLVMDHASGDWMWAAEVARGDVKLLRVPLALLSNGSRDAPRFAYRRLPRLSADDYRLRNRFVGQHLLYGAGSGWDPEKMTNNTVLYVAPWAGGPVVHIPLPHGVDRIESMGSDAVAIGVDTSNLHFTGIDLARRPRIVHRYVRKDAAQGELRSHGFFYHPDGADSGLLGLPIRGGGQPGYMHLGETS